MKRKEIVSALLLAAAMMVMNSGGSLGPIHRRKPERALWN
jgi:hypothetical protein